MRHCLDYPSKKSSFEPDWVFEKVYERGAVEAAGVGWNLLPGAEGTVVHQCMATYGGLRGQDHDRNSDP